jgi:FixJ family two-component response regulator
MTMSAWARNRRTAMNDRAIVDVINDDVSPREALSLLFTSVRLNVRTYASVQVDAGHRDGFGCILLDVRLRGISGLDSQSRRDRFGIHLPIVLMSGHGDGPMSVRAMKAGGVYFLPKPFCEQDMIDKNGREKPKLEEVAS